jgi:hypothetical protein
MLIDCDTCSVRGTACRDCVVTFLAGRGASSVDLTQAEADAIGVLAVAQLIPPLRHADERRASGW